MDDDIALLSRYAKDGSEEAFAELVQRHLGFVYNTALRQVGGTHRAQDVAQAVFTDLARKAGSVSRRTDLMGWLHKSTHFASAKLKRSEQRREIREHEAHTMQILDTPEPETDWSEIRPVLDDALRALSPRDREAVLLRFFHTMAFSDIGRRLGLGEDAARMRVDRAVKALRDLLARRGVTSSAGALAAALAQQPVVAVPAGLASLVAAQAVAGAAAGGVLSGAVGSFIVLMNATKTAVVVGGAIVVLGGGALWLESSVARNNEVAAARRADSAVASRSPGAAPVSPDSAGRAGSIVTTAVTSSGTEEKARADALFAEWMARSRARTAIRIALEQAREAKRPTLDPANVSPLADPAALESLVGKDALMAYFERLGSAQRMAALEYLFALPAAPGRQLRLEALFQAWIARDAVEAMAAAERGGIPLEKTAVDAWARMDLPGAWSWVEGRGLLRGDYALALVGSAAALGRESIVADWLTPLTDAYEMEDPIKELARLWAGKDPAAAVSWLPGLAAMQDQAFFASNRTVSVAGTVAGVMGGAMAGRPVAEVVSLVQHQEETLGTLMLAAAAKQWMAANQYSRIGEFEKLGSQMSDTRVDAVTATMVLGLVRDDPEHALSLVQTVKDLRLKRLKMNEAWTVLLMTPGKEEQAMRFALAYPDDVGENGNAIVAVYTKFRRAQPEQARAYLERATLPPAIRAKLESL